MTIPRKVKLVEVGPRDGLQNEKTQVSVADRIAFIEALIGAGLNPIEVGAFVSPKAIPQMVGSADVLRRVIASDVTAEEGHDLAPHYLPDGRIVFSSTRQRLSKAVLIDEGKPQFAAEDEDRNEHAFVLHVMNADGSGQRNLTQHPAQDNYAAWSPDSKRLAFISNRGGGYDVYVMNAS